MRSETVSRDETRRRILAIVAQIPAGKINSYGQIAARAGSPGRARRVGKLLAGIGDADHIPWHRVTFAQGRIAGPPGSAAHAEQLRRLAAEGVGFRGRRADIERFGWRPQSDSPLID